MKKIVFILIATLITSVGLISCDKDEADVELINKGTYKVIMDGKNIAEGSDGEVGFAKGDTWSASVASVGKISILMSSVPTSNGGEAIIDGSNTIVSVNGTLAGGSYLSVSGTITRISDSEISFEGKCKDVEDLMNSQEYSFEITISSSAYKMVK